jgi:hypothetical protein
MNPRHALHPDLNECMLEDRCLLYTPGLYSTGFLPSSVGSPLFIVPGFSNPGGGGPIQYPGPTFSYILIGGGGAAGLSQGSASAGISIYGLSNNNGFVSVTVGGAGAGSRSGGGGGSPSATTNLGYGSSVSSGYATSLNISNNYGVSSNPVGSIPVHSFDNGSTTPPANSNTPSGTNSNQNAGNLTPDANTELWNSLLKRSPRGSLMGTGTSTNPGGMSPP